MSIQISGPAAPDARDPAIMIAGFVVLGGCLVVAGPEFPRIGRATADSGAGLLIIAVGSGVTTQSSPTGPVACTTRRTT